MTPDMAFCSRCGVARAAVPATDAAPPKPPTSPPSPSTPAADPPRRSSTLLPLAVGVAGIALVIAGVFLAMNNGQQSRLESALNSAVVTSGVGDDSTGSYTSASAHRAPIAPASAPETEETTTTGVPHAETTSTTNAATPSVAITASIAIGDSPTTSGPGIREPRVSGMAAAEDAVWAVRPETGTLYRLDTTTGEVVASVQVGGDGTNGTEYSVALGFESVWVLANDDADVVRVDASSNEAVARIEVGQGSEDLAASDDAIWVIGNGHQGSEFEVARIDPTTNHVAARHPLPYPNTGYAQLAHGHGSLWALVSSGPTGYLLRLDPIDGSVLASIELSCPGGLSVNADGVWTTDQCPEPDGWRLLRIDQTGGSVTAAIPSPVNGPIATDRGAVARATAHTADLALVWWSDPGSAEPQLLAIEGIESISEIDMIGDTVWIATEGPASVIRVEGPPG